MSQRRGDPLALRRGVPVAPKRMKEAFSLYPTPRLLVIHCIISAPILVDRQSLITKKKSTSDLMI